MVAPGEGAGALDRPQIGDVLDDAEQCRVAPGVAADGAGILRREVAADGAEPHIALEGEERPGKLARVLGRRSEHALYAHRLSSYAEGETFPHAAAEGFITLASLETELAAARERSRAAV